MLDSDAMKRLAEWLIKQDEQFADTQVPFVLAGVLFGVIVLPLFGFWGVALSLSWGYATLEIGEKVLCSLVGKEHQKLYEMRTQPWRRSVEIFLQRVSELLKKRPSTLGYTLLFMFSTIWFLGITVPLELTVIEYGRATKEFKK